MQTKQIPKNEWSGFFDSFSRMHQGWLVNLQIAGPEIGAQMEQRELALKGITDEWHQTEGDTIMIMSGVERDDHITHSIVRPTQVSLQQTDDGADAGLAIKSDDGTTTLLWFRSPVLSELVDAVAP